MTTHCCSTVLAYCFFITVISFSRLSIQYDDSFPSAPVLRSPSLQPSPALIPISFLNSFRGCSAGVATVAALICFPSRGSLEDEFDCPANVQLDALHRIKDITYSLGLVISSWSLVAESDPCETPAQGKGAYQLNSRLLIATS